ncbi:MAG: LysR family transcriptional regulator [Oscillospiraceae bacterium]|nr:LysR family transcriptional regulator [Oscillospiraceae bacterium]MDD6146008.1 LysR family transcriptional regulator [Oscillospiraceae bacterium]
MNILHLKYATEIAKTKSISKAAENLYMGQPNLSRAIKELEEHIGITIFNRTSKGISVTAEGEEFLMYARRIIDQVEQIEDIYVNGKRKTLQFSVSVPRASYIGEAFTQFAKNIEKDSPAEFFYKETNSMKTVSNVLRENYNLGIVRYQAAFDEQYKTMFEEKKLNYETVTDFTYELVFSKDSPLASLEEITPEDLADYVEICHADPYVPSMPLISVKKAELSEFVDKRIYVFERASQMELLSKLSNTFMWVSPIPADTLERYGLTERKCPTAAKQYKDVLIYRKGYKLTALDKKFITELINSRRKNLSV